MLDVQAIPPDMQAKIASALAARFGVDVDEVLRDFDEGIAPILASGCQAQTNDPAILAAILL
jgi:ribosomal protein L12E/L44/L45/RPP1/RPP2